MGDLINRSMITEMLSSSIIFFLLPIVVMIAIIITYSIYQRKVYMKSEYFAATKTHYSTMRRDSGLYGEYLIYRQLTRLEGSKRFLFNCYLPKNDGSTSEVDVILLHSSGIYVFESKNYSGWIFGTETQRMWTQTFRTGRKEKFYNPIMQNSTHVKWLMNIFPDIDKSVFFSIIVFSERCELKKINLTTSDHIVLKRSYLLRAFVDKIKNEVLPDDIIESMYQKLYPFTQTTEAMKTAHIDKITKERRQ
jgi:hypothetical protein